MSTKHKPAKAVPAKKALTKSPASKPAKEQPPELNIKVTKSAETTSLTGTGVLGYEIGSDEAGETHYRITTNNAGGFFSQEWVSWPAIYGVCNGHTQITSVLFRALFKGKCQRQLILSAFCQFRLSGFHQRFCHFQVVLSLSSTTWVLDSGWISPALRLSFSR